jgi:hypothetical protein
MTVTLWPASDVADADGASLDAGVLAPGWLAAGLGLAVEPEQAAATSATTAIADAVRARMLRVGSITA